MRTKTDLAQCFIILCCCVTDVFGSRCGNGEATSIQDKGECCALRIKNYLANIVLSLITHNFSSCLRLCIPFELAPWMIIAQMRISCLCIQILAQSTSWNEIVRSIDSPALEFWNEQLDDIVP